MTDSKNLIKLWNNSEKRKAFLENYQSWGVWITTPELDLTYYRYIMPDGAAIIAMEHMSERYDWKTGTAATYEKKACFYVQKPDVPFLPRAQSISSVAEILMAAKAALQKQIREAGNNG